MSDPETTSGARQRHLFRLSYRACYQVSGIASIGSILSSGGFALIKARTLLAPKAIA